MATSTSAELFKTATMSASVTASGNVVANVIIPIVINTNVNATANITNSNLQLFDPNFANVSLLLHGNGANGSTTFTDNSPNAFTVTGNGNAQISTAQSKFGGASIIFDGNGDYLTCPTDNDFSFSTGNFTVELWFRLNNVTGIQHLYDSRPSTTDGTYPTLRSNGTAIEYVANGIIAITGSTLSANTWYHLAVTRSGTSTKLFLDGNQVGSTYTDSTNYSSGTSRPLIGGSGYHVTTLSTNGYIDDVRVTKGIARYTTTFNIPTREFLDQ